jgi:hypothetical protein
MGTPSIMRIFSGEEARQAARLLRQCQGRDDELVAPITSAVPSRLDAPTWLRLNRHHWGVESVFISAWTSLIMMTAVEYAIITPCGFWA